MQLSKGAEFTKLSFKKGSASKRFVFYSDTLNALCWRDSKSKFPKTKQILYLSEIKNICTSYHLSKVKKNPSVKIDDSCFFSIEAISRTFDLVASSTEVRNVWVKTLNLLLLMTKNKYGDQSQLETKEYESVARQFVGETQNLEDEIEQIKHLCNSNEKNTKKTFLETAENFITKEAEQKYNLNKTIRVLEKELEDTKANKENFERDAFITKKHLESAQLQQTQLMHQMRSYNQEKNHIIGIIREF
jgi:hypothetical protein